MGRRRKEEAEPIKITTNKFVPADPRCKDCYYWRSTSGYWKVGLFCCHHLLDTGIRREQITQTECGSFVSADSQPKRTPSMDDVPMSQWGCGGFITGRKRIF